jgi:hypothetical protein
MSLSRSCEARPDPERRFRAAGGYAKAVDEVFALKKARGVA